MKKASSATALGFFMFFFGYFLQIGARKSSSLIYCTVALRCYGRNGICRASHVTCDTWSVSCQSDTRSLNVSCSSLCSTLFFLLHDVLHTLDLPAPSHNT